MYAFIKTYKFSLLFLGIITVLMVIPGKSIPENLVLFNGIDFLLHILLFGFLSIIYLYERKRDFKHVFPIIYFIVFVIIYSFLVEILQQYIISGRTGSYYDFTANIIGLSLLSFQKILPVK